MICRSMVQRVLLHAKMQASFHPRDVKASQKELGEELLLALLHAPAATLVVAKVALPAPSLLERLLVYFEVEELEQQGHLEEEMAPHCSVGLKEHPVQSGLPALTR